jgi:hypothetical protein
LPHPGILERAFVLYPLADIAPELDIPGMGRVADLKRRLAAPPIRLLDADQVSADSDPAADSQASTGSEASAPAAPAQRTGTARTA